VQVDSRVDGGRVVEWACDGFFLMALAAVPLGLAASPLLETQGDDAPFAELLSSGKLQKGATSRAGVAGSVVQVRNALVETTPEARRPICPDIRLHTLANSSIPRGEFKRWSRWYQEDGSTQVFRLFQGETNIRNERENAARVEAFSVASWRRGAAWHEWSGTFTVVRPHGAAIFQAKNSENDWAVQITMDSSGNVRLNHRRAPDKVIAEARVGKPFHVRVRDNGHNYEVFLDGSKVGEGFYARPEGVTSFRWGMYLGGSELRHDAMILVSGATIEVRK